MEVVLICALCDVLHPEFLFTQEAPTVTSSRRCPDLSNSWTSKTNKVKLTPKPDKYETGLTQENGFHCMFR
ncbi:hypothetical protein PanWU01x14_052940 [Parasponia andersonii]|uniref:Uncharacterized protein n=1 Tax=Parasponia andersonii TaxID=3476 RepID=A0A2P5DLC6_PARAD|nr:hypothetical protein PanWU01x14_052940 [Parasponia andersonii]